MAAKVIQGSFLGSQPRLAPTLQPKMMAPRLPGPSPTAFTPRGRTAQLQSNSHRPGPPAPAASLHKPAVAQPFGGNESFAVDPGRLGLASGGGRPLPDALRGKMEAALGADFSNVRVHVGPQAERIGAIAFTVGSDIYFAPGRYQPDTIQSQQLLGHELVHVMQQRQGRVRNPVGAGVAVVQDRALEAEADRLAQRAVYELQSPRMKTRNLQPKRTNPVWTNQALRVFRSRLIQLKPPSDPHVFMYEDEAGRVWSRDAQDENDRWYLPGKNNEKIYWTERQDQEAANLALKEKKANMVLADTKFLNANGTLKNAANAILDDKKFTEYALNSDHSKGGNKALVFKSYGYSIANWSELRDKIKAALQTTPATPVLSELKYGSKFNVEMSIPAAGSISLMTMKVVTSWIVSDSDVNPKLVTLFVE